MQIDPMRFSLRLAAPLFVLIAIAGMIARDRTDPMPLSYEPYTPETLEAKLDGGSPVLLTIFGNWTLSTQMNDALVRQSVKIKNECRSTETVFLRADWTNKSPVVTELLHEHALTSVPATIVYCPNREAPILLLDLVTEEQIVDAVRSCSQSGRTKQ
ncbi:MAG TPA: hypothetical protein DDW52_18435 [Planctomycetaceae bacterium]|nr:hypothetical protein [Planctomycetaceae bacterium]